MTKTKIDDRKFQAERKAWADKAAAIIAADKQRTPAEQAALAAVDEDRWVLWHTDAMTDLALAVIRLLSRADLLRDKAHEEQMAKADEFWSSDAEQRRAADWRAIGELGDLVDQAAAWLEAGADPAEVAGRLYAGREAVSARREVRAA